MQLSKKTEHCILAPLFFPLRESPLSYILWLVYHRSSGTVTWSPVLNSSQCPQASTVCLVLSTPETGETETHLLDHSQKSWNVVCMFHSSSQWCGTVPGRKSMVTSYKFSYWLHCGWFCTCLGYRSLLIGFWFLTKGNSPCIVELVSLWKEKGPGAYYPAIVLLSLPCILTGKMQIELFGNIIFIPVELKETSKVLC